MICEKCGLPKEICVCEALARLRERGNTVLADAAAVTREAGVACESVLIETMGEDAAHAIIRDASAVSADLIAMGTHGRRGLRRLAMGSDAEIVLRYSPAPLLLVRETPAHEDSKDPPT